MWVLSSLSLLVVVVAVIAIDFFLKELNVKSQVQEPGLTGLRPGYEALAKKSKRPLRISPVDDVRG